MSTPAAACSVTTWRTAASLWRASSALSTASPTSSRIKRSDRTVLRGRLPTCVVRMRSSLRFMSIHLGSNRLHHLGPLGAVSLHRGGELLDALPARRVAELGELLLRFQIIECDLDRGVEFPGNRRLESLRSEDREPGIALVAGQAGLVDGWDVRDRRD